MRSFYWLAAASLFSFAAPVAMSDVAFAQSASQRPVEHFATLPAISSMKLSPSGDRVIARVAKEGETILMVVPLNGGTAVPLQTGDQDVLSYNWVNDDWLVMLVGGKVPFKYGGEIYITRTIAVKSDGSESQQLLHKFKDLAQNVRPIWVADDGTPRVMVAAQRGWRLSEDGFYPEVYMVDVSTDKADLLSRGYQGVFSWHADNEGNLRMGYGYNWGGDKRRVLYRRSADSGLKEIESGAREDEQIPTPNVFLPGDKALTYTRGDEDTYGIYEYDPVNLKLGKLVHRVDGYDGADVRLSPDGSEIIGLGNYEAEGSVTWLDPTMKQIQADIEALTRSEDVGIVSTNDDYSRVVFRYGRANQPGAYYLYDVATKKAQQLGFVNSDIQMDTLHSVQAIRYDARDGLEIEAILTIPTGGAMPMPLVVLPHGGPYARDTVSYDWMAQFLADRGYVVLQPNYRGSSGYGKAFEEAGKGEWGHKMQDDLIDGIAELAKSGLIDKDRVCIVGASYGGYAALRASQRDADHYRCAVSYAGVSDLKKAALEENGLRFGATRVDWLTEQAPNFEEVSPLRSPQKTSIPVLLMHGKEDEVVDVGQSRSMAKALEGAGKDVVYIEQKEGDHFFSREEDRLQFLMTLEAFLKQHNPA